MKRRELTEVILDIKNENPLFNREELLQYTKWIIPKLYNSLKNEEELKVKCKAEAIDKFNKEKSKYRINKNMDRVTVQYVELFDSIKKENEMHIQVYVSIYFYDDVDNNIGDNSIKDKYWNDIWIVTYRQTDKSYKKNSNCGNCGSVMKYNKIKEIFECTYCGNIINNQFNSNWEIIDIEVWN